MSQLESERFDEKRRLDSERLIDVEAGYDRIVVVPQCKVHRSQYFLHVIVGQLTSPGFLVSGITRIKSMETVKEEINELSMRIEELSDWKQVHDITRSAFHYPCPVVIERVRQKYKDGFDLFRADLWRRPSRLSLNELQRAAERAILTSLPSDEAHELRRAWR